ncbi:MAG: PSD1 and planctomycete cytochrome C domain-containing protein [Planctomycetota bacterium]
MNTRYKQLLVCLFVAALMPCYAVADDEVSFARDIRPILSDTCFKCHGPDEEHVEGGLRLDLEESVFDDTGVVEPGDLESELYLRIISHDESDMMPPPDSGRSLNDEQKDLIRRWIEQGAQWQGHWSFEAPQLTAVPPTGDSSWPRNEIDNFILDELEKNGLDHSQDADRATLIRRVTLDLTGLPPSIELTREFMESDADDWYEQLVDRLLQTEQYGEHMARFWLDVARYGDTHGLHLDNYREMWLYRDWVINSFNDNQSFKDFAIEQLAGDLLENPTDEQLIATGFNRAHVTTAEGGSIKEEVMVRNVVDRVSTTGTVFMGLTVGCAQCHDHKFDPVSQDEFYQLFAFFNSLDGDPMDGNKKDHAPVLRVMNDEQKEDFAAAENELKEAREAYNAALAAIEYVDPFESEEPTDETDAESEPVEFVWLDDEIPSGASQRETWTFVKEDEGPVFSGSVSHEGANGQLQHFFQDATVPLLAGGDDILFTHVYLDPEDPPSQIMLQWNDGSWEHRAYWGENKIDWGSDGSASRLHMGDLPETGKWIRLEVKASDVGFAEMGRIHGWAFTKSGGHVYWDKTGVISKFDQTEYLNSLAKWIELQRQNAGNGLPGNLKNLINKPLEELEDGAFNENQLKQLRNYFLQNVHPESVALLSEPSTRRSDAEKAVNDMRNSFPTTLVWRERAEPKPAYFLNRGEYDQKGDEVQRATPAALPPMPEGAPVDRLGLAMWLFDDSHPLTARVTVNRFWQQVFGTGLVVTAEDFGAQGEMPSHPELLDWLAVDFMRNDWDVRRLMKMLVMSSTYRQSSAVTSQVLEIDPANRLLSHAPRYRLDAEVLRDQALAVSGLLVQEIGGPSVKPPQPDGLWFVVGYSGSNTVRFKKDEGHEKVHRRSLYTFWKRTAPPPQMNTFDAPSRESCTVRRERTNTPLQALLLMNDPQYVEAARYLAAHVLIESGGESASSEDNVEASDIASLGYLFRRATGAEPTESQLQILHANLVANRLDFEADLESASMLIAIGEESAADDADAAELASWTMVASLVMNMDEFVNKN